MYIHIQLCIIRFLEDITFYFPLIKTLELEQSLFCKLQAILQFISTYGTFCMFITILIITYYSYYHHETLQLKGFRIQLICSIVSWIITIGLTIVQSTQVIKSGPVAVCRCEETTTKLFSIMVSFIFATVLNVLICTLIKGLSKEQKSLVSKQDQSMLKMFIKKLITFNVPLILSVVYMVVRLPRKYYDEKTIGLFLVLLISETIRRMTGEIYLCI
jgi:hypothetical protein